MDNPDVLKDSKIKITKSNKEYKISIPGYKLAFKMEAIFIGAFIFVLSFLIYNSSDIGRIVRLSIILTPFVFFTLSSHFKTVIYFSKENIKVRHGLFPFVRKRQTNNIERIFIHFEDNSEGTRNDINLRFSFSKEWKISILVTHLSIRERNFLTGRLNYFRYKFSTE